MVWSKGRLNAVLRSGTLLLLMDDRRLMLLAITRVLPSQRSDFNVSTFYRGHLTVLPFKNLIT